MMLTKTGGRWLIVNHKHTDYQSSIVLILVNVTNTTRLYADRIERKKLEFKFLISYIDLFDNGEFFQFRVCVMST